jgi:hypothetical protein
MSYNVENSNYAINRIGGSGNQGLYEESSTAKYPIGEKLELNDGRIFRYGYAGGTALAAGVLVSPDFSARSLSEADGKLAAASAGATSVTMTVAGSSGLPADFEGVTADGLAGSYLITSGDAGAGYNYRIKGNTAASSDAVTITLFDGLVVAVTTATDAAIAGHPFHTLNINAASVGAATDTLPVGVSVRAMTANYYGWFQTHGVAAVLVDNGAGATITVGSNASISDEDDGKVQFADDIDEAVIGKFMQEPDNDGHTPILLNGLY